MKQFHSMCATIFTETIKYIILAIIRLLSYNILIPVKPLIKCVIPTYLMFPSIEYGLFLITSEMYIQFQRAHSP